jgi:hypothetical protein
LCWIFRVCIHQLSLPTITASQPALEGWSIWESKSVVVIVVIVVNSGGGSISIGGSSSSSSSGGGSGSGSCNSSVAPSVWWLTGCDSVCGS